MKRARLVGLVAGPAVLILALAGFAAFDNPVGQVRTLLLARDSIASPIDGELAQDARINLPVLRHLGLWRSLRYTGPGPDPTARTPDYRSDLNGVLTVQPGYVTFASGNGATNSAAVVVSPTVSGPPTSLYASWRALFAYSNGSGGFAVALSADYSMPDAGSGVPAQVVTAHDYRYLGSVGAKPEDGHLFALWKTENHFYYEQDAQISKDTSGSVQVSQIQDLPSAALSASFNFEFDGPGNLTGPFGEVYAMLGTGGGSVRVNFELHRENGVFLLNGSLQNCEADGALQYITGHTEDPSLFVN